MFLRKNILLLFLLIIPISIIFVSGCITTTSSVTSPSGSTIYNSKSSALQGKIAFDSKGQIFVMNANGSNVTQLTHDQSSKEYPSWSPDGTKILYVSVNGTYIMNADGSNQSWITDGGDPSWSPDGEKIAYSFKRDNDIHSLTYEIYSMSVDGSNKKQITNNKARNNSPHWSPDGSKIVFDSNINGDRNIYIINTDGTNTIKLTDSGFGHFSRMPAWSPDGEKIVFSSDRDNFHECIYVMNSDGSNQIRITNGKWFDGMPSWSPDGKTIIFVSARETSQSSPLQEIYFMDSDGANQTRLTYTQTINEWPVWSK